MKEQRPRQRASTSEVDKPSACGIGSERGGVNPSSPMGGFSGPGRGQSGNTAPFLRRPLTLEKPPPGARRLDAPVAQLDRASASGAEGQKFESSRVRSLPSRIPPRWLFTALRLFGSALRLFATPERSATNLLGCAHFPRAALRLFGSAYRNRRFPDDSSSPFRPRSPSSRIRVWLPRPQPSSWLMTSATKSGARSMWKWSPSSSVKI